MEAFETNTRLMVEEERFEIPLSQEANVSQVACWSDILILNVKEKCSSLLYLYNRKRQTSKEIRFDGLISFQVLFLGASEQDVIVVASSSTLGVFNLPDLEPVATRSDIRSLVLSVNHALEKIVLYCKKAKTVQILSPKLEREFSWVFRQEVKQLLLLDNGSVYILNTSGACYLLQRDTRDMFKAVVASPEGWHTMCRPNKGAGNKKVVQRSKKGIGVILIPRNGRICYGDNQGNIQETPLSCCNSLPTSISPTDFGLFLCFSENEGFDILVDVSRHDLQRLSKKLSESNGYVQTYSSGNLSKIQGLAGGQDFHGVLALIKSSNESFCHIIKYTIDESSFEYLIKCLTVDKLFDTALNLILSRLDSSSAPVVDQMHILERKVLYNLACYQIYEEKEYRHGALTLSTCCRDNAIRLLMFFDFLLPLSLQSKARDFTDSQQMPLEFDATSREVLKEEEQEIANALLPYLWSHRSRILRPSISRIGDLQLTLLDSAIFNCLLRSEDDGTLLQFLSRRDVSVDYESSKILLQQNGKFLELLELYKSQGHHSTALDLLKTLSTGSGEQAKFPELTGRRGAQEAAKYLYSISDPEISLIKFHSRWMMEFDPSSVLEMLLRMYPSISTAMAVTILSRDGNVDSMSFAAQYLEQIMPIVIRESGEVSLSSEECTTALLNTYLHLLMCIKEDPEVSRAIMAKLEGLLASENTMLQIDFQKMLDILPLEPSSNPDVLQARVWLLQRMRKHREALEILILRLSDSNKAEEYCKRACRAGLGDENVYLILLQIILSGQNCDHTIKKGLAIISQHQSSELAMRAFHKLPRTISIKTIHDYIKSSLNTMKELQRKMMISKHMARGRIHGIFIRRMMVEKTNLIIQSEDKCQICYKKVGVSAHVFDGTSIFHYSCFTRSTL